MSQVEYMGTVEWAVISHTSPNLTLRQRSLLPVTLPPALLPLTGAPWRAAYHYPESLVWGSSWDHLTECDDASPHS